MISTTELHPLQTTAKSYAMANVVHLKVFLCVIQFLIAIVNGLGQCGDITSEKEYTFRSTSTYTPECSLRVYVTDNKVTQLRLDFEDFSIAPPEKSPFNYGSYQCLRDSFTVESLSRENSLEVRGDLLFDKLCGENSGQHTPEGCLQYYPDPFGTFESFNYNGGAGHYQGLLNYAICFKRYNTVCSMQYNAEGFQLPTNDFSQQYDNRGCNVPTNDTSNPYSQDFLFIPDATTATEVESSIWCGTSLLNNLATTNAPGPLYVFFRTDKYANEIVNGNEIGFRITYQTECGGTKR
ncbi:hypothetical protein J437_LFUL000726 [Ladona fulva]|uniref:CUB domain-containing protein n=1 Tax=Ladona fulva TaxID=123851 RepID=A0A8K0JZ92_LADFU|nr:hypothetical protein J437_LFUL000726 [Ladona fulva]